MFLLKKRSAHARFKIRNKLLVGFSALFAVLLTVVILTLTQVSSIKNFSRNLTTNTLPTFNAIQDLNIGLQGSSASLQEWMLTGDVKYKTERNQIWRRIEKDRIQINQHAKNWNDVALSAQWKEIEALLQQLQLAQAKTEGIAHSDQENVALTLLKKESDPNFLRIFHLISQIIDIEKKQPATEVRKKLLINMADFRGNLASAVGNVNLFSITGNSALLIQIEAKLKETNKAEAAIQSQMHLLTDTQAINFKEIQTKKAVLLDVLNTILKLRQKDDWNLANYVLNNEVAMLLNKTQTMLGDLSDQTNHGLVQQLQQRLVHDSSDVNKSLHFLGITQWVLLAFGIMLSIVITWLTSRSIVKPIRSAIEIASRIAKGERGLTIRIIGNDESADLLCALSNMYDNIFEAEKKLKQLNKQVVAISRQAGMSEVAALVLHNIGNVLNSANVSLVIMHELLNSDQVDKLESVVKMLQEGITKNPEYIISDSKGKLIPVYLSRLSELLMIKQNKMIDEMTELNKHIDHIKDIVLMQNEISGISGIKEKILLEDVCNQAIQMSFHLDENNMIKIRLFFEFKGHVFVYKNKLLQILVNLIQNAKDALIMKETTDIKLINMFVREYKKGLIEIQVSDNGVGIEASHLKQIFSMGFTTKNKGYGFGLHMSAIAAKEMGGELTFSSEGKNLGATFTLKFPVEFRENE